MNCPICKKQTVPLYKPFCSKRCADVDLGRWLNGAYAIALEDELSPSKQNLPDDDIQDE